ncbi:phosphatase PAP2 family protein [Croceibacterium sp. LX-88]|uniref:Acid phosphatase n=1 Tax=Croceibacterium selenioxidans TaxID=2838833 RepID=A0ABS5W4E9_9SPHN|nr:phosphatase PAP2 family protein [Croceibacterium selenioxidans]MBT2134371.1 phosphatase PAP2 family protein [Croceibacterium selenioxidans]
MRQVLRLAALSALAAVVGIGAWSTEQVSAQSQQDASAVIAQLPPGYLPREALPDSLALLPPPPEAGSAAMERDEQAREATVPVRNTPRWALAASDADLNFPHAGNLFSCAAGIPIGPDTTPKLYALLGRMLIDVGLSTYKAKTHYNRPRPFVTHGEGTCYPPDEDLLRHDGSYPSGHSAAGWGWALVLAELMPDRADAILQRGRDFGQSRVICDAHWQSDVEAGRVIASGTVARLHADPAFQADLAAVRQELADLSAATPPSAQCEAESAILSIQP